MAKKKEKKLKKGFHWYDKKKKTLQVKIEEVPGSEKKITPAVERARVEVMKAKRKGVKPKAYPELFDIQKAQAQEQIEEKPLSTLEQIAKVGLTPAATIAAPITEALGGTPKSAEELARTPTGKVIGIGTVATATALFAAVVTEGILVAKASTVPAGRGSTAVIERIGIRHFKDPVTGSLLPRGNIVTQRAFVGRPAIPSNVAKIFHTTRPIAARYATNGKSIFATHSILSKISKSPASLLVLIGTYPFAGFIKEEAIQQLSFATNTATKNKDVVNLEKAIIQQEELLDPSVWEQIMNMVPFVNVYQQLWEFFRAAWTKLEADRVTLEKLKGGK